MTRLSVFEESLFAMNFKRYRRRFHKENSSISIFPYFCHHTFLLKISASVMFLSLALVARGWEGSCFIHIYRFSLAFSFFVWETHFSNWFRLNFSLSPTRMLYRHRQFAAVVVLFPKQKKMDSGRWGDMFRHYVAIYRHSSVGSFHVCSCDNLHIWPHRMICRTLYALHTGD